eukprot:gnl/MRDRNA2_/MRDRNA2_83018_c0_seq1.p1 gnl/MRDRNA2_/MRDRNA2_83018_c0~~gnl/MRDRNA2_/MRDRNA2_83018_c0_seq1.p1  ORF type:complete len:431 (-),score=83.99 gnl/MRDRNA2_/MRDRNA2_83018_c0_seq1:158-1450(-)
MLQKAFIEPQKMGYSNAVATKNDIGGITTVTLSGCVGWDPEDHTKISSDLTEQTEVALASMARTLKASGCPNGLGDVIKVTAHIVDLDEDKAFQAGKAFIKAFKHLGENQAASSWIGTTGLVDPKMLIEIEAVAQFNTAKTTYVLPTIPGGGHLQYHQGLSKAVVTTSANGMATVTCSGHVGWGDDGKIPTDLTVQAESTMISIGKTLEAAGVPNGWKDVIKINTWIVNMDPEKTGKVGKAVFKSFKGIDKKQLPAMTWVGSPGLVEKGLGVEIECTAEFPISPSPTMNKSFVQPQKGFSNGISVTSSTDHVTTVRVSGQVGWNPSNHDDIPQDLSLQTENALTSMASILKDAGCPNGLGDVIGLVAYIVNIDDEKVGKVGKPWYKAFKHLGKKQRAASTWVGVTGLVHPALGVEIECTAQFKSAERARL